MAETCSKCGRPYGVRRRCYYCNGPKKRTGEDRTCATCGTVFYVQVNQARGGEGVYCSYECKYQGQIGVERVAGTRYVRRDGYVSVKVGIREYDLEHRLVMKEMIGRDLLPDEQVHHLNGNRADNRPENLQLLTNAEHQRLHGHVQTQSRRVTLICKRCGKTYERKPSRAAESSYCSAACRLEVQHDAARAYWARRREE